MKRPSIAFVLLVLFCACDPDVDFSNIDPNKLISITCFISPQDTVFTAYIYRGSPVGSTIKSDSAAVKDAEVIISDGKSYDTLFFTTSIDPDTNQKVHKYTGVKKHLSIDANLVYTIDVTTRDGIHAFASCRVPPALEAFKVNGERVNDDYNFSIEWTNRALSKYFLLILEAEGRYKNPFPGATGDVGLKPSLNEELTFPSDKQVLHNRYEGTLPYAYRADDPSLTVSVRNVGEELYKYFTTFQEFENWVSNNSGGIIPNFTNVGQINNNITGGVGIFGAYNTASLEIEL